MASTVGSPAPQGRAARLPRHRRTTAASGAEGHRAPSARHAAGSTHRVLSLSQTHPLEPAAGHGRAIARTEQNEHDSDRGARRLMWSVRGIHRASAAAAARIPYRSLPLMSAACSRFLLVGSVPRTDRPAAVGRRSVIVRRYYVKIPIRPSPELRRRSWNRHHPRQEVKQIFRGGRVNGSIFAVTTRIAPVIDAWSTNSRLKRG